MIRVLLADDHAVVAEGLGALLRRNFELVGIVRDGRALVEAATKLRPDVVVTDISMPLLNGLEAIRRVLADVPRLHAMVLTMYSEPELVLDAFRAGALGYVLKTSPGEQLVEGIREVSAGRPFLAGCLGMNVDEVVAEAGKHPAGEVDPLTPRQREILQLVGEGRTMKEIASILGISPRTAESHKYEVMRILGAKSTADLVHQAIRLRIVPK